MHRHVPSGTLDLLVLRIIERGPIHGRSLTKRLGSVTDDVFQITLAALLPALQRVEDYGWRQLAKDTDRWAAISLAVTRVLDGA